MIDVLKLTLPIILTGGITLLAVYLTTRSNRKVLELKLRTEREMKEQEVRRDKLEELYVLTEGFMRTLASHYLPIVRVMQGEITYDQALDMQIAHGKNVRTDFSRIQMLVDLYFNRLQEDYRELISARDLANSVVRHHKEAYKNGDLAGGRFVEPMRSAQLALEKRAQIFRTSIVNESRRISR